MTDFPEIIKISSAVQDIPPLIKINDIIYKVEA